MTYHLAPTVATAGTQATQADLSAIGFLAPVLVFLMVAIVLFALLRKSKILGEHVFFDVFVSLFVAAIFAAVDSVRELVLNVVPWFAVLLMAAFFILVLTMFVSNDGVPKKFLAWSFLVIMVVVFLVAGVNIFSGPVLQYLPGPFFGAGDADPQVLFFFDWFYSPPVIGAFWLLVAAAIVSWVLIKFSAEKN